jgi:hypothetical protein
MIDVTGYLEDIRSQESRAMATRSPVDQIAFRYRPTDSTTGVTRSTARRLAAHLGVDETQVIHLALHEMAVKLLPQYEADDTALTAAQLRQIKKRSPQGKKHSVRSSLFEVAPA